MILQRALGGLVVVRQTAHGDQTGLIAEAWVQGGLAADPGRRGAQNLAARHHDDGWALWERHPTIDPSHERPYQFVDLPPAQHLPMYRAGIDRAAEIGPWTGLLVSMHGAGLYNDRYGTFALRQQKFSDAEQTLVNEFLQDMERMQTSLGLRLGHQRPERPEDWPELWHDYLLLQVWDRLSLEFVIGLDDGGEIAPLPTAVQDHGALAFRRTGPLTLRLSPYPFADAVVDLPISACVVADRPYPTSEAFLSAVHSAPTTVLECRAQSA